MMTVVTVSEASKHLDELLQQTKASHEPVHITGSGGECVLISVEDWQSISETLHLASIPGMTDSIVKGLNTSIEDCSEDPGWTSGN